MNVDYQATEGGDRPHFYSVKDACRLLSAGKTTVYALLRDSRLSRVKRGRRTLIPRESLDNYAFVLMLRQGGGHAA